MARRSDHTREELYELAMNAAIRLADENGLRAVTSRGVAREIGYTIGTIYNIFDDLDDLILQLNGRTLDDLYVECAQAPQEGDPEARLLVLADHYIRFTRAHAKRWSILFEHRLPDGKELPPWHHEKIIRLLSLVEAALVPFFSKGQERERHHVARVLWSSLHGICSLEASNKLVKTESVEAMAETLIKSIVGSLKQENPTQVSG